MKAMLTASAPILLVKDVVASANWYRDKCGFTINNVYGEPPFFAIIDRDGYFLMFAKCKPENIIPNWKLVEKTSNVYFWVDNVDELFREFSDAGATIDYGLSIRDYGVKEFGINDPDGYDIAFGQVIRG